MAKLVFSMNQSLDGYVDHLKIQPPGPLLFRHFVDQIRNEAGAVYGRRIYETMRYWEQDLPEWDAQDREFAAVWRNQPKWVASRTLKSVGPYVTLVEEPVESLIRRLKAELNGVISVAGPNLARSLTELGLIDEYRLYIHPVVLGSGTPFFAAARSPLRFVAGELIADGVIRLTYVPV